MQSTQSPATLLREQRITLNEAARICGVNPSTAWRWALSGARGTKLETFCLGAKRYTTVEALARFSEACTAASVTGSTTAPRTPAQRERDIKRAEAELAKLGV